MAKAGSTQKALKSKASISRAEQMRPSKEALQASTKKAKTELDKKQGVVRDKKGNAWNWLETEKDKLWTSDHIPEGDFCVATVKRSFSKDIDGKWKYYGYRSGNVMGRRDSAEDARKLVMSGKPDSREDNVAAYVADHAGNVPAFLRLTELERSQVQRGYPGAAPRSSEVAVYERVIARERGLRSGADLTDPGTVKLLEELAAKERGKVAAADPEGSGGRAKKSAPTKADRAGVDLPDAAKMVRARDGNPKKPGSAAFGRWALMFEHADKGSTVAAFLAAKGNPETLRNAVLKGFVKLEGGGK